ncbi:MAG: beta-N-acetylhexosaminidase [bacterium]
MSDAAELLGSLLICGFEGSTLPEQLQNALSRRQLGGVILFARNYQNREQLRRLTDAIREAQPQTLIAVDQEGGRVVRFAEDFPTFPSPAYYVEQGDLAGLYQATKVTAAQLRELGVNFNLTPVCDLAPTAKQHVIATRAASSDPALVSAIVKQQITIMREEGILSCAKHFPGLGSAVGDPHSLLSRSSRSREEFRALDYQPFRAACEAGVDAVMPTHLLATNLDSVNAATFSRTIVQEELRGYLGFEGLVITDDLTMGAVTEYHGPVEAAEAALRAGCDLLLYERLDTFPEEFVAQVATKLETEEPLSERLLESNARLARLRENRSFAFDLVPPHTL